MKIAVNYKPSWLNVVRIAVCTLFFLWLFGKAMPDTPPETPFLHDRVKGTKIIPMITNPADPRGARQDNPPIDEKDLKIVWITDSGGLINPQDAPWETLKDNEIYIDSNFVSKNLTKKYKLPNHRIILYSQLGSRAVNRSAIISHAISQNPDMIVMTFNPMNPYNSNRIFVPKRYMNMAPPFWIKNPDLAYLLPLFATPAENLWALTARYFRIINDSFLLKEHLKQKKSHPKIEKKEEKEEYPDLYNIVTAIFDDSEEYVFGVSLFEKALTELKNSGVPTLIYMVPIADTYYNDPEGSLIIRNIDDYAAKKEEELKGTNIRFISEIPKNIQKTLPFCADGFHLKATGKLDEYLAEQIWHSIKQYGMIKK